MRKRSKAVDLRPQPGPQEAFLSSSADVAIYGGSAGSGKTFSLLLEPLFHKDNGKFRGVIFRRTIPQAKLPGGLWDVSADIYPHAGAKANETNLEWEFPSGAVLKIAGLELEANRFDWQGAQLAFLAFDELTHFSESQFFYLLSRVRSMSGIPGYVRATCNPDADSWVRSFISWWIDDDTGFPIKQRSGALRWFVRDGESLVWADSPDELSKMFGPESAPKSVTFVPARIEDNKLLMEKDPSYLGNLKALPSVEREALWLGNWNVRPTAGSYFRREWISIVDSPPPPGDVVQRCRFWDRAATEKRPGNDPDASVGVLLSKTRQGIYTVENVLKMWASAHRVSEAMLSCARSDPPGTLISYAQDPGSAGVFEAQATARMLDGFAVKFATVTGDKETRAKPISAQAEAGNVRMVRGNWNEEFIRELEGFPIAKHDDAVDGLSGAHHALQQGRMILLA